MKNDDPRHGSNPGYNAGCRDECCRKAHMIWMKRYRMYGADSLVDATGTHRRLRALVAIGHTLTTLSGELGMTSRYAGRVLMAQRVRPGTARAVDAIYERLSMTVPAGWAAKRGRRAAKVKGWAPPLAWDDIDNPDEIPSGVGFGVVLAPCGTDSAYKRHVRRGEPIDAACRNAHRIQAQSDRKSGERKEAA